MIVMQAIVKFPQSALVPELRRVSGIVINSSFREATETAEITIGFHQYPFKKTSPNQVFKIGSPVQIYLGYNYTANLHFMGYVTSVSADFPCVIKCQNEMWKLKREPVNYSAETSTVEELLKKICPGYKIDALENAQLGSVRLSKTNVGEVLDKLRSEFGLYTFFDGKTLVCGKYYSRSKVVHTLSLDKALAESNLVFRNAEDMLVKVKLTGIKSDGSKLPYEMGEEGGDTLEISIFGIETDAQLKVIAKQYYDDRKRGGFSGDVSAFGKYVIKHGEQVQLISSLRPDKQGRYYIDSVVKEFNEGGIKQRMTLGGQAK